MTLSLDKPGATRIARNLAQHLKSAHGLEIGHQTAMTALAAALGYRSLNAFVQDAKSGPPAALDAFGEQQMVDALRQRGYAVCSVNPRDAAGMAGVDPDTLDPSALAQWFSEIRRDLEDRLHQHAEREVARAYELDDAPFEGSDADDEALQKDLPDGQIADPGYGGDAGDMGGGDRAIDQCAARGIELVKKGAGWVWYMPDSKNPAKRVPGISYASEEKAALAACKAFGIDPSVFVVMNSYRCPDCEEEWEDPWFSSPDDECPSCGCDIEPYESQSLIHTDD